MKIKKELLAALAEEDGVYDELQKKLRESEKRRQECLKAIAKDFLAQLIVGCHECLTAYEALDRALDGVKLSNTEERQEIKKAISSLLTELSTGEES